MNYGPKATTPTKKVGVVVYIPGFRFTLPRLRWLNSPRAIAVNIAIMRAFVRLREALASNKELARKFEELERKLQTHDQAIAGVMDAIRQLMAPPDEEAAHRLRRATGEEIEVGH